MIVDTKSIKEYLYAFILIILAVANASPRLLLTGNYRLIYFGALALCMIVTVVKEQTNWIVSRDFFVRLIIVILMFVFPLVVGQSSIANRYLHLSGMLLYPYIYDATKKTKIPAITTFGLVIWAIVVAIPTIEVTMISPYASREADSYATYQAMGVGSYMYIYAIALGSVLLFCYIINNFSKKRSKLFIFIWGLLIFTIYKANFMTALLVVVIGSCLGILCKKTSLKIKIIGMFLLIIGLFLFMGPLMSILSDLISLIMPQSGRIANVFNSSDNIFLSISNEFIGDRLPKIKMSFDVINSHPLGGLIFSNSNMNDFGNHSTFFDTLAIWGIPVGLFYFYLSLRPFLKRERLAKYEYTLPILFSYLILVILNNVECTSAFVMFYILPFVIDTSVNNCNNVEET